MNINSLLNQISMNTLTPAFTDIFRNGTRDNIKNNPEIIDFIIGALDNSFTVKLNGYMPIAKKGKVEIMLRHNRDNNDLGMVIFKGKEKLAEFEYKYGGFLWVDVEITKGRFYHNRNFICSFL